MSEKISRLLDGDLSLNETVRLLKDIEQQPELKNTLTRYVAVRHAIQHQDFLWIPPTFSSEIQQQIQQVQQHNTVTHLNQQHLVHRYYWFALAAAACAALAIVISDHVLQQVDYETLQMTERSSNCTKASNTTHSSDTLVKLANYCNK